MGEIFTDYKFNIHKYYMFTAVYYGYLWMPIWLVFLRRKGMSLQTVGFLDGVVLMVGLLIDVPTGAIADKFGRKYSMSVGPLLYALGMYLVTLHVMDFPFLLGYILWNTADTFVNGANTALLYDSLKHLNHTEAYTKVTATARGISQASMGASSLVGAWLAQYDSNYCFYIACALGILAALISFTLREPPKADEDNYTSLVGVVKNSISLTLTTPALRYSVMLMALLNGFTFVLAYVLLQTYAIFSGFSTSLLGAAAVSLQVSGILGSVVAARIKAKYAPHITISALTLVLVTAQLFLAINHSSWAMVSFALVSFSTGVVSPSISLLVNKFAPSEGRATIFSFGGMLTGLAIICLELIDLVISSRLNVFVALVVNSLLVVLSVPIILSLLRRAARSTVIDMVVSASE